MIEAGTKADFFKLRTPLLSKGRLDTELTRTDNMRVWMKCYAEGGENVLHAHPSEDHIFVILQGQARFHDKDDNERVLGRNEGIMLPAGAFYYFESCGDEPLVMLRVGAYTEPPKAARIGLDGHVIVGNSEENKHEDPVAIEGAFYE
ncbi:MAG TPA: cupin domain-containing protein [Chloroflexota bacterium]|jgi:mannose-6-phosphate isomerase-like protein (cupin superfamily)